MSLYPLPAVCALGDSLVWPPSHPQQSPQSPDTPRGSLQRDQNKGYPFLPKYRNKSHFVSRTFSCLNKCRLKARLMKYKRGSWKYTKYNLVLVKLNHLICYTWKWKIQYWEWQCTMISLALVNTVKTVIAQQQFRRGWGKTYWVRVGVGWWGVGQGGTANILRHWLSYILNGCVPEQTVIQTDTKGPYGADPDPCLLMTLSSR